MIAESLLHLGHGDAAQPSCAPSRGRGCALLPGQRPSSPADRRGRVAGIPALTIPLVASLSEFAAAMREGLGLSIPSRRSSCRQARRSSGVRSHPRSLAQRPLREPAPAAPLAALRGCKRPSIHRRGPTPPRVSSECLACIFIIGPADRGWGFGDRLAAPKPWRRRGIGDRGGRWREASNPRWSSSSRRSRYAPNPARKR